MYTQMNHERLFDSVVSIFPRESVDKESRAETLRTQRTYVLLRRSSPPVISSTARDLFQPNALGSRRSLAALEMTNSLVPTVPVGMQTDLCGPVTAWETHALAIGPLRSLRLYARPFYRDNEGVASFILRPSSIERPNLRNSKP